MTPRTLCLLINHVRFDVNGRTAMKTSSPVRPIFDVNGRTAMKTSSPVRPIFGNCLPLQRDHAIVFIISFDYILVSQFRSADWAFSYFPIRNGLREAVTRHTL